MLQRDLHQQLRAESIATRERIATMVRPLDSSKLHQHPEPKGWSIGEVLEHLCLTHEVYERPTSELLQRSRPDAGAALREWKPSFVGKLIANSLLGETARKAPKVFRLRGSPRNGVVEDLLAREQRFVAAMDDAVRYDWQALRIRSPAFPAWGPKMNLGDRFRLHVIHVTRHARQIERLVGQV